MKNGHSLMHPKVENGSGAQRDDDQDEVVAESRAQRETLMETARQWQAKNKSENETLKAERNARRWRLQRKNSNGTDTPEYAADKKLKRDEYAAKIEAEGRSVRAYEKIEGATPDEREANKLKRDRERKAKERANATQADRDAEADRKFRRRRENAGDTPEQIEAKLAKVRASRAEKRVRAKRDHDGGYDNHPLYGIF